MPGPEALETSSTANPAASATPAGVSGRPPILAPDWNSRRRLISLVLGVILVALGPIVAVDWWVHSQDTDDQRRQIIFSALGELEFQASDVTEQVTDTAAMLSRLASDLHVSPSGAAACTEQLALLDGILPGIGLLAVIDLNGKVYCASQPVPPMVGMGDLPQVRAVLNGAWLAIGTGESGWSAAPAHLSLAIPIEHTGQLQGVVHATFALRPFQHPEPFSGLDAMQRRLVLIDSAGGVLASGGSPLPASVLDTLLADIPAQGAAQGAISGPVQRRLDAGDFMMAATPLDGLPGSLRLVTIIPMGNIDSVLFSSLLRHGGVTVAAALLAALAMYALARLTLFSKIERLAGFVARFTQGDRMVRTGFDGDLSDIGRFARGLDWMADAIVRREQDLIAKEQSIRDAVDRLRLFASAVDGSSQGVVIVDARLPDMPIIYVNPAFSEITGYGPKDVLGQNCRFLQGAETAQPEIDRLRAAIRAGREILVEVLNFRKNGEPFWNELLVTPLIDHDGHVTHFIGFQRDVTQRRAIQAELEQQKEFATATLDAMTAHICVLDVDGTIIRVNQAWRRFAESNGAIASSVSEGVNYLAVLDTVRGRDAAYAQQLATAIREIILGRRSAYDSEYPCHAPFEQRWFKVRVNRFGEGDQRRIVVAHESITELKLQEVRLREEIASRIDAQLESQHERRRFQQFAEASHDWFWETDSDGRLLTIRGQIDKYIQEFGAPNLGGLPLETLSGERAPGPRDGDRLMGELAHVHHAVARRKPFRDIEFPRTALDGTVRYLRISGGPVFEGDGRFVGYRGAMSDVTDQRRRAEALMSAETQVEAKTGFIAAASHDLRQPVQALSLYLELLDRQLAEGPHKVIAGKALGVTQNLMGLINALLDLARLEARMVKGSLRVVDLAPMIERLAFEYRSLAVAQGGRLDLGTIAAHVETDPNLLERALRNLISNAVKFSTVSSKGGHVLVGVRRRGDGAVIEVWDNGPGIAPDLRDHVFHAFETRDQLPVLPNQGPGLGLAIVRQICSILGHGLELQSVPGRGTVFRLHLPQASTGVVMPPVEQPVARDIAGLSLLLVEDTVDVREALSAALKAQGVTLAVAADLGAALGLCATERFDVILADFNLPGGATALELVQQIRQPGASNSDTPVVIFTGTPKSALPGRVFKVAAEVLQKPVDIGTLVDVLSQHRRDRPLPGRQGLPASAPESESAATPSFT